MTMTIHLGELGGAGGVGFLLFRSTAEEVAKWKGKEMGFGKVPLRYRFREELFDKVSLSRHVTVTLH
jgi:hypothetical protein